MKGLYWVNFQKVNWRTIAADIEHLNFNKISRNDVDFMVGEYDTRYQYVGIGLWGSHVRIYGYCYTQCWTQYDQERDWIQVFVANAGG